MTLSAVLLAGGDSRRMGTDKATLDWEGRPFWQRQLDLLRELEPETIFVSVRTDPLWRPADTELLLDQPPSRGPLSGITGALARARTSHLLVLAIDMVFMTTPILRALYGAATDNCGAVALIDGHAEPVAAVYPTDARACFAAALAEQNASLQPLVRRLIDAGRMRPLEASGSAAAAYRSVNRIADLALVRRT